MSDSHRYVWRWRRWRPPGSDRYVPHVFADRFDEPCCVLARGRTMHSVAIELAADGWTAVVSERALRRAARADTARDRQAG